MAQRRGGEGQGAKRATGAICAALVAAEVAGFLAMLAPVPVAWMWIGGKVYEATGSLGADLLVAFGGFFVTLTLTIGALGRIDRLWVELRRRGGHDQRDGVLTRVVVVIMTFAMFAFWVWFHILSNAFIIPFMPMN